jgi:ElaB/YqjD/DUF883 family membrane-anchored ribosome-binding protein
LRNASLLLAFRYQLRERCSRSCSVRISTQEIPMAGKRNGKGAQHVEERMTALRDDIDAIQDDMKGLAGDVGEAAMDQADGAKSYMNDGVDGARSYAEARVTEAQKYAQARISKVLQDAEDVVDRLSGEVEEWATENVDTARETIRNQPLAACVLSMSAGALIGALLLRR